MLDSQIASKGLILGTTTRYARVGLYSKASELALGAKPPAVSWHFVLRSLVRLELLIDDKN